ncbi:hypothetical protein [Yinghuangia sp. YIM S10712]|uniref:hypothetical protein n=1 Tax=Yinghuangia sp. YIM S10712 TaxID=3436930 RepID=UPI003F53414E
MSVQGTGNRVPYPDYVLWQGEKFGKLLLAAVVPLILLPLDLADIASDTGLPQGAMAALAVPLSLFVVLGHYVYKHRKIALSAQGMVLYGMSKTRQVAWADIVSVTVKLRLGTGEAPSSVTLHATRRDGGSAKHTLNFIAAEQLPWFAKDIKDAAALWGIPTEVKGSRAARNAFEQLEAQSAGAWQHGHVPPRQQAPYAPPGAAPAPQSNHRPWASRD